MLEAARSLGDGRRLLFNTDGSWITVEEHDLAQAAPAASTKSWDVSGFRTSRRVGSLESGPDALSILPGGREIVLVGEKNAVEIASTLTDKTERLELPELCGAASPSKGKIEKFEVPMAGGLDRVALSPDRSFALCATSWTDDLVISHKLCQVSLRKKMIVGGRLESEDEVDFDWFPRRAAFVLYDSVADRLWRWSPGGGLVPLRGLRRHGRRVFGLALEPATDQIVWCEEEDQTDRSYIRRQIFSVPKSMEIPPTRLQETGVTSFALHSRRPFIAVYASGETDSLVVMNRSGAILTRTAVPNEAAGVSLLWFSDDRTLLSVGKDALALWQPF